MWILKEIYDGDNIIYLKTELDCNEDPITVYKYLKNLYPYAEIEIVGYMDIGNRFHLIENIGTQRNVINVVGKKDNGIRMKYLIKI